MEKHSDQNEKTSDDQQTPSAKAKPKYEAPVVMPLGELARGWGANCGGGSGATGFCSSGPGANGQCTSGGNGK